MLVYRFTDSQAFSLLESETTARGPVTVRVEGRGDDAFLRVSVQRQPRDAPEAAVVIGLPLIAIDGNPQQIHLDVLGYAGEPRAEAPGDPKTAIRLFLEAADARGWGLAYCFGDIGFSGWQTCAVDAHEPCEYWGECEVDGSPGVVPPVQPYHVRLALGQSCRSIDVGLRALSVTGEVRLAPPGIASPGSRQS